MPKVYGFELFDINKGDMAISKKMATRERINKIEGAIILEETAMEVDTSKINPDGFYQGTE